MGLGSPRRPRWPGGAPRSAFPSEARAVAACHSIAQVAPTATVHPAVFDVSVLGSVRAWVASLTIDRLDVLVHNRAFSGRAHHHRDGFEQTVATNLVGPMALTAALLPHLSRSEDPRIIWVSSGGMLTQKLDVDATFDPPTPFDGVVAYARTKRAEVVVAERMQRELGPRFAVYSMHPGWAATPGVATSLPRFSKLMRRRLHLRSGRRPRSGRSASGLPRAAGWVLVRRMPAATHPVPGTGRRMRADRLGPAGQARGLGWPPRLSARNQVHLGPRPAARQRSAQRTCGQLGSVAVRELPVELLRCCND